MILKKLIKGSIYSMLVIIFALIAATFIRSPLMVQVNHHEITRSYKQDLPLNPLYGPIIKYVITDSLCSGVVIDANYALTASHCVVDGFGKMLDAKASIIGSLDENIGTAQPIAVDRNRDVALLKGNFNNFQYSDVDFSGETITNIQSQRIVSCGFPAGGVLFCSQQHLVGNNYFRLYGFGGLMEKGMSGGPVIDMNTNKVIGVNSAVVEKNNLFGPVLGVKEVFGL